jgi:hypothetical protein
MEALMKAKAGTVTRRVPSRPTMTMRTAVSASREKTEMIMVLAIRPESANTSPCAKLMSCRIP